MGALRRTTALLALVSVAALSVLGAACAPTAPPPNQVPNPTPSQVVAETFGATIAPQLREVSYDGGIVTGCGPGAATHEACNGSRTLDVYAHDPSSEPAGTIVFVHGGGFTGGDKSNRTGLLGPILFQTTRGWDVVSVNYRLNRTQAAPWPAAVTDVAVAISWIRTHAGDLGVDPSKIVVAGHSAGGTIAALNGVAWNSGDDAYSDVSRVDGWIDMAGINDFTLGGNSNFWGIIWLPAITLWRHRMSPTSFIDASDPPGYVIAGDSDGIVSTAQSHVLQLIARQRGASVGLDIVDAWANLTWMPDAVRNHNPGGGVNLAALDAFLDAV